MEVTVEKVALLATLTSASNIEKPKRCGMFSIVTAISGSSRRKQVRLLVEFLFTWISVVLVVSRKMALIYFIAAFIFSAVVNGDICNNPQVHSKIYTTTDATIVSDIGFIAEFTLSCTNNVKNVNLYAEVLGRTMTVIRSTNGDRYQVSWASDPKEVKSYQYPVKIYDEDGYAKLRKAQRAGEDSSAIQPLFTIDVNHRGASSGPWFQSEFLASIVAIAVWYFAYATKSKLML